MVDIIPAIFTSNAEGIGPRTINAVIEPYMNFSPDELLYGGMFDSAMIYNIANFKEMPFRVFDGSNWHSFTIPQGTFVDTVSVNDFFEKIQESLLLFTGSTYAFQFTTNLSVQRTILSFDNSLFPNIQIDLNPNPLPNTENLAYKLGFTNDYITGFIAQGAIQTEYTGNYESKISSFIDKGIFLVAGGSLKGTEAIFNSDRYSNVLYRIPIPADVRVGDVVYSNPNSVLYIPLNTRKIQDITLRYMLLNDNGNLEDCIFTAGNNSVTLVFKTIPNTSKEM